jgi:site-specific DNA-methyltransferase (adenine-specific)
MRETADCVPTHTMSARIPAMPGKLYYGDCFDIMDRQLADESIDLIYLDPPFNSDETYGLLHKGSQAQQEAFWDSWHWDEAARGAYAALVDGRHGVPRELSDMMVAMKAYLAPKHEDMLAYLSMLALRLVVMRRKLRRTGSLYLHCDSTASHYIKLLLDLIFGPEFCRNEITWVRTNAHNFKSRIYPRVADTIFFYTRSDEYTWNAPKSDSYSEAQMKRFKVEERTGRLYKAENMTMFGSSKERSGTWRGATPKPGRVWGMDLETREKLWADGRILTKRDGKTPRLDGWKIYLDETKGGKDVSCVWDDISRVANKSDERTGYATQKPVPLLKRIISTSSNAGDTVLDPFCGCGTTVEAAEELGRAWIGIDIAIRAIDVTKERLDEKFQRRIWEEYGEPKDVEQAERLAKNEYDFQWWAVRMLGGSPPKGEKKKGADDGVDGELRLIDDGGTMRRGLISVKAGRNLNPDFVKTLNDNVREKKYDFGVLATMYDPTQGMRSKAADYGPVLWADPNRYRGKVTHKIRIATVGEWLPPNEVQWPGRLDRPKSRSVPPPPAARPGDTLHLPFAPAVPRIKKANVRPPGTSKTKPYETTVPEMKTVAEKGSKPPKSWP